MGDLFGSYKNTSSKNRQQTFDDITAYEENYMKLLKKYQNEIHDIAEMVESVRKEREEFYLIKYPAMKKVLLEDGIIENKVAEEWLQEVRERTERSFLISESLVQHYVTKNLDEFKKSLRQITNQE